MKSITFKKSKLIIIAILYFVMMVLIKTGSSIELANTLW